MFSFCKLSNLFPDEFFVRCPFQVHGFPRVMGVLTHLDMFKDVKKMRKTKKTLKHRFWTDVYPGAKLFYLSGTVAFAGSDLF